MSELDEQIASLSPELDQLRQNVLLDEAAFITFARDRGIGVSGVVRGDPGTFHSKGWLKADGTDSEGHPLFHPFRLYPLHCILKRCGVGLARSAWLQPDRLAELVKDARRFLPSEDQLGQLARTTNEIADLAVLLEPVYWPRVTSRVSHRVELTDADYHSRLTEYRARVLAVVRGMDVEVWKSIHEAVRCEAAWLDDNSHLYMMLRLARWSERERLKGATSAALWMRHIAEVIRRGFEDSHPGEQWLEEDQAFGRWLPGGRMLVFGSERPLDIDRQSAPYLAWTFGLFTGSGVRWYVEGDTEFHAILEVLPEPSTIGVELVNLRGNLEAERGNVALSLRDGLAQDQSLRRFSFISFDRDVAANVRTIQRQVSQGHVVGFIAVHDPDFEFANFAIAELIEVAVEVSEAEGGSQNSVGRGDWSGITTGRMFQERYQDISGLRGLKGERWGRALAAYAVRQPKRSDTGAERPFLAAIEAALRTRLVHYDLHKETFRFDPNTFELIDTRRFDPEESPST